MGVELFFQMNGVVGGHFCDNFDVDILQNDRGQASTIINYDTRVVKRQQKWSVFTVKNWL